MTIDNKFPDINAIEVKLAGNSISLNFPHFGTAIEATMEDPSGNPATLSFAIEDLSITSSYNVIDDKNSDIDF